MKQENKENCKCYLCTLHKIRIGKIGLPLGQDEPMSISQLLREEYEKGYKFGRVHEHNRAYFMGYEARQKEEEGIDDLD